MGCEEGSEKKRKETQERRNSPGKNYQKNLCGKKNTKGKQILLPDIL